MTKMTFENMQSINIDDCLNALEYINNNNEIFTDEEIRENYYRILLSETSSEYENKLYEEFEILEYLEADLNQWRLDELREIYPYEESLPLTFIDNAIIENNVRLQPYQEITIQEEINSEYVAYSDSDTDSDTESKFTEFDFDFSSIND